MNSFAMQADDEEETEKIVYEEEAERHINEEEPYAHEQQQRKLPYKQEQQKMHGEQHTNDTPTSYTFLERQAMRMARWPKTHFWIAFLVTLIVSFIGFIYGDFEVKVDNVGWDSRGTLISNRETQLLLARRNSDRLFNGGDEAWEDLLNNVQPGFDIEDEEEDDDDDDGDGEDENDNRRLLTQVGHLDREKTLEFITRRLQVEQEQQEQNESGGGVQLAGCDLDWYSDGRMFNSSHLSPVWKTKSSSDSFLHSDVLLELCLSEENTQQFLEENGLCFGCDDGRCLPPFSIVMFARLTITGGLFMDCEELADAWFPLHHLETQRDWKFCVEDIKKRDNNIRGPLPDSCGQLFHPMLVDEFFDTTGKIEYTTSTFATAEEMVDDLYDNVEHYDRGAELVEGVYDTQFRDFNRKLQQQAIGSDMLLATMSAIVTTLAMLIHTRSLFLTLIGLVQIILSFPTAFFVYSIIGRVEFFPFLNFIGVFVVFALGADHVFVAVDKWKNARLENPHATTEQVAAKALPDAAGAMFLTTLTTAAAFFGTGICVVAPIKLFAVFCGLLISLDYIMDVFLVFPCLCIYDNNRERNNCFMSFNGCCQKKSSKKGESAGDGEYSGNENGHDERPNLIHRILLQYYAGLDYFKWPVFVVSIATLCICTYFATQLQLPQSSEVRLLSPGIEYERAFSWRGKLLSSALGKSGGHRAHVIWGVKPADTGDHNNPEVSSQLVLDECFFPSSARAQTYLKDFCPAMYAEDFADPVQPDYECPINRFDKWLQDQHSSASPDSIYLLHCAGEAGLPMEPSAFDPCLIAWSYEQQESSILSRDGMVMIMYVPFQSRVRFEMANSVVDKEWHLINDWMDSIQADSAPYEVSRAYFSSGHFWWYDTNTQTFQTALGSAAIALGVSAIVILLSSRSVAMTVFSVISVAFVLTSVTSLMVAIGWTLGFLESVCFSILIGVSVDFVIHFSHAYSSKPGNVNRQERTKFALVHMGPSVLAAASTTMAGAIVMLFTVIVFFQKFALVLFLTIVQATIGSFVVFLTLTDCVGPSNPTALFDQLAKAFSSKKGSDSRQREGLDTTVRTVQMKNQTSLVSSDS